VVKGIPVVLFRDGLLLNLTVASSDPAETLPEACHEGPVDIAEVIEDLTEIEVQSRPGGIGETACFALGRFRLPAPRLRRVGYKPSPVFPPDLSEAFFRSVNVNSFSIQCNDGGVHEDDRGCDDSGFVIGADIRYGNGRECGSDCGQGQMGQGMSPGVFAGGESWSLRDG
jgi:hypothetical protein